MPPPELATREYFVAQANWVQDCLLWKKSLRNGYGHMRWQSKNWYAHRLALVWQSGMDRVDDMVLHACGNRSCVNVFHLRWGNHVENAHDAIAAGSLLRGAAMRTSKLKPEQVEEIWTAYYSQGESLDTISARYPCSRGNCQMIVESRSWSWLTKKLPKPNRIRLATDTRGEKSGNAKLTDTAVRWIRANLDRKTATKSEMLPVAEKYGVSYSAIKFVVERKTWRHIP
ncbi:MAG: hypothetical protein EOO40_00545 [Deltaproteobacteria bacterium]|nr:MAG: hypothetical protein EOO40_00545 [Deltaproteobacteria bacterium]